MKSLALLLLLIGIILITIGISKTNTEGCPTKIETRKISSRYLDNVLEGPDNYKNIFEDKNIGIPDSNKSDNQNDLDYDSSNSNIHNIF